MLTEVTRETLRALLNEALGDKSTPESRVPRAARADTFGVGRGRDGRSDLWTNAAHVVAAQARSDVAAALAITAVPTHQSVVRWRQGIPRVTMGHADRAAATLAVARRHRIMLAGADYRGVSVNDLCADAAVVVKEVTQW